MQDRFVQRYSKPSASTSRRYALEESHVEEYGYALPLGRGIEKCPVPQFDMPATVDVRPTFPSGQLSRADRTLVRLPPLPRSRPPSSSSTPTTCRTLRAASRSTTERPPSRSSSRAVSSSQSTRERPPAVTSVRLATLRPAGLRGRILCTDSTSRRVVLIISEFRTYSLGNGQESDRDQPVPARNHGRWCRHVQFFFCPHAPEKTTS